MAVSDPSLGWHVANLAMGKMPSVQALVDHYAPQYGVDPVAAMQVSHVEGGGKWGAVGDQGTSYGPWQLHMGGALPAQYATPTAAAAFANSPEGVKYVLSRMAKSGAAGLTGKAAVAAIVRGFERPADPEGEIAKAMGMGTTVSAPGGLGAPPAVSTWKASPLPGFSASLTKDIAALGGQSDPGLALLNQTLASQRAFSNSFFKGSAPAAQRPASVPGTADYSAVGPPGRVKLAAGADRAGVSINPGVVQFVAQVAGVYGQPLTIGTGTNHNRYVLGTQRESAHWTGNAADVPASGDNLTRLGQDALIAAGMPEAEARQQKGGLFNIGGKQIIFNSMEGGNHFNHLHVGLQGEAG